MYGAVLNGYAIKINYAKVPSSVSQESVPQNTQVAEAGRKMLAAAGLQTRRRSEVESTPPRSGARYSTATPLTPASQGRLFEASVKRVSMGRFGDEGDAVITLAEGL
jgi:hypothetical protein